MSDHVKLLEESLTELLSLKDEKDLSYKVEVMVDYLMDNHFHVNLCSMEFICQYYFPCKEGSLFFKVNSEYGTSSFTEVATEVELKPITSYIWEEL